MRLSKVTAILLWTVVLFSSNLFMVYSQPGKNSPKGAQKSGSGSASNAASSVKWVAFNGTIPADAVVGGFENGQPMYVGRVAFEGGIHPGKVLIAGVCNIGWGGKEYSFDKDFEIMTAPANSITWVEYKGMAPANAILGGYNDAAKKEPLYIAKHAYKDGEHCGKLWAKACNIGWGGAEVVLNQKIFVLAAKEEAPRPAGPFIRTNKTEYFASEPVTIEYSGFPGSPSVWLNVVLKGQKDSERGEYVYAIEKEGMVEFHFSSYSEGEFEVRAFFGAFDTAPKARTSFKVISGN